MRPILVLVLLAGVALAGFAFKVQNKMADFEVYWTAAGRAAAAEPLYRAADGHYQFKYLPAFALATAPLGALPLPAAKVLWFALSVAALVAFLLLSLHLLPDAALPRWAIVTVTIVSLGKFYAHEIVLGQTNLLFGVVAIAAVAALRQRRDLAAGATFAAAVIVKPYGAIFLPYLLATTRVRAAAACVVTLAAALLLPALLYGFRGNLELLGTWWESARSSTAATLTNQDNVSIAAMYAKWLGVGRLASQLATTTSVALLAIGAVIVTVSGRRATPFPEYLEIAFLLTAIPLISPQGWDYVLLLSTPAVMVLAASLPRLPRGLQIATITCLAASGLSLYDVMGRAAYARFMALSPITVCFGVLLGVLVYLRAKKMH